MAAVPIVNGAIGILQTYQTTQRLADLEVRQQMIGQGFYAIVQSFLSITPAAVYLIAGLLLAHGTAISAGTIVAFTTLQTRLYFPVGQLLQVSVELRSSLALFDRVFEYLDVVPDIVDAPDAVDLPAISSGGRVALREVYFRYPGTPVDALAGVSFDAGPGQLVALVGPSGAGKTTISYLIPRLYDVTGGSVQIDGLDVRHVRQASLAAAIGFVTQESYLFHDSILANIRYGRPAARCRGRDAAYLRILLSARGCPGPASLRVPSGVNNILIINKAVTPGRVTAIIVNERLGF